MKDDLISRLSELRCQHNCFDENERDAYHTLSDAIKALSDVPDTNVGDMISRQAAISTLIRESQADGAYGYLDTKSIVDALERMPSVDIDLSGFSDKLWKAAYERGKAEVVRCKDCKWFNDIGCSIRIVDDSDKPTENDYCSFGERNDG